MSTLKVDAIVDKDSGNTATINGQVIGVGNTKGRNLVINGGFDVWQRGTTFTTSGVTFCADRFAHYDGSPVSNNVSLSNDVPTEPGVAYSCLLKGGVDLRATVELPYQGVRGPFQANKKFTLSFYAKRSSAGTLSLSPELRFTSGAGYSTAGNAWSGTPTHALSTDWTRHSATYTCDQAPTSSHYAVGFTLGSSATVDVYITGIQLEEGEVATNFETKSYAECLTECQRYYWEDSGTALKYYQQYSQSYRMMEVDHPVKMRTTPAATIVNNGSASSTVFHANAYHYKAYVNLAYDSDQPRYATSYKFNAELTG